MPFKLHHSELVRSSARGWRRALGHYLARLISSKNPSAPRMPFVQFVLSTLEALPQTLLLGNTGLLAASSPRLSSSQCLYAEPSSRLTLSAKVGFAWGLMPIKCTGVNVTDWQDCLRVKLTRKVRHQHHLISRSQWADALCNWTVGDRCSFMCFPDVPTFIGTRRPLAIGLSWLHLLLQDETGGIGLNFSNGHSIKRTSRLGLSTAVKQFVEIFGSTSVSLRELFVGCHWLTRMAEVFCQCKRFFAWKIPKSFASSLSRHVPASLLPLLFSNVYTLAFSISSTL